MFCGVADPEAYPPGCFMVVRPQPAPRVTRAVSLRTGGVRFIRGPSVSLRALLSSNLFKWDAARLSCACKRLRDVVPDHSSWPRFRADGSVLSPLSGTYHVTVSPSDGWAGLKKALSACPEGGSVLAGEGEYVYGPGD